MPVHVLDSTDGCYNPPGRLRATLGKGTIAPPWHRPDGGEYEHTFASTQRRTDRHREQSVSPGTNEPLRSLAVPTTEDWSTGTPVRRRGRASENCRRLSMTADTPYWLAFNRIPTIGRARFERLERAFGTLAAAWSAAPGELEGAGIEERSVRAIVAARATSAPERELAALQRAGVTAFTWNDAGYPALLKESFDRPPLLYVRGTIDKADDLALAVVGTRRMSAYGRQATEQIVGDLVRSGITIISGLARGVDATAHTAALRAGGRTLAVLPCGVDIVYPAAHERLARQIIDAGALVSEHPPGTRPQKDSFPRRNRIIAGLALGVVVTEAPAGSGALLTAKLAADDNRDVFAVPGSIFSPMSAGTNALIQEGAKLTASAADVLAELNLSAVA